MGGLIEHNGYNPVAGVDNLDRVVFYFGKTNMTKSNIYKNLYRLERIVQHLREHNVTGVQLKTYLRALEKAKQRVKDVERRAKKAKDAQKRSPL